MPGWLDRLFGRHGKPVRAQQAAPATWLAADAPGNPFATPILNLMILQQILSTTSDPALAARSVSWRSTTGRELTSSAGRLFDLPPMECRLSYPAATSLPDGILYAPPSQDFKWVLALHDNRVLAARSWTGIVEAVADARREGETLVLERLRVAEDSCLRFTSNLVDVFDWLLRAHIWDQRLPLPVDDPAASLLEQAPVTGFGPFGKALFCAAKSWNPPPPPCPLGADGDVIVASRQGDVAALREAVEHGADINAPGSYQGFTALHLAIVKGDATLFDEILRLGANPRAVAHGGMHALLLATAYKAQPAILERIAATGIDLTAPNLDGFTALHGAAEIDNAAIVPWLVAQGLPLEARTRHGHTALHIASALGQAETATALLTAGADVNATSPQGTPRQLANAGNKPALVTLLDAWPASSSHVPVAEA